MTTPRKLMIIGELFEQATRRGVDEVELAVRLLAEFQAGLVAYGYRRQFTFPVDDKRERLPRDTHRQPVPNYLWHLFDSVLGSLESVWADDPEGSGPWANVDWVSGQIESLDYDADWRFVLTQFNTLAIEEKVGRGLIAELSGAPKKRPGRKKGPSSDAERTLAQKGFELIRSGDNRPPSVIAAELADRHLAADKFERQKRRILSAIKALLAEAENPAPE